MLNILICDDDRDIVNALKIYLTNPEYNLFTAYDGKEAVKIYEENELHLVLMDIMMPVMDGIQAMVKMRETGNVPVILLTAKSEDTDKILGLDLGADDYITKPFNPSEVIARVKSQLRRYTKLGGNADSVSDKFIKIGGIELDDFAKQVTVDGNQVMLTPKEYDILKFLMMNPGRVFSPADIYRNVWQDTPIGNEGTVSVHIRHLREKIEINPAEPRYLTIAWGQGYKFEKRN